MTDPYKSRLIMAAVALSKLLAEMRAYPNIERAYPEPEPDPTPKPPTAEDLQRIAAAVEKRNRKNARRLAEYGRAPR